MNRKERRRLMQQGEAVPPSDQKAFNVSKARVRAAEKKPKVVTRKGPWRP